MFGLTIIRTSELAFYRDVHALIKRSPEYLEGIRAGVVHLAFDPGHAPQRPESEGRRPGRSKLVYDKEKRTIVTVPMTESAYRAEGIPPPRLMGAQRLVLGDYIKEAGQAGEPGTERIGGGDETGTIS